MELSAAIFQDTLTKMKSDKGNGNAARRARPRVGLRCALTILPYANVTIKTDVRPAVQYYIAERQGYDYNQHGKAGNEHATFVPDEVIDRFCLIGAVHAHAARLRELESLGVDQFALYLQHDAKSETLAAYGDKVLPAVNVRKNAKA